MPGRIRRNGFTLVEMAVALLVLGLIMGAVLAILPGQLQQQRARDTAHTLEAANEAIIGYALGTPPAGRPYLPCPDSDGDGLEDRAPGGGCLRTSGFLPWATLGLGRQDAWGHHLHYRVLAGYADPASGIGLALPASTHLKVCTTPDCRGAGPEYLHAIHVPALIVSGGENGYGTTDANGVAHAAPPPANVHERANLDGDTDYVWHEPRSAGNPGGEFDDMVNWISPGLLRNRLLAAGRLP
ncbi:type II secretion system protein [Chitinimonas arctica]|nr:type II secretion system protein [Chitinimonas arctica]